MKKLIFLTIAGFFPFISATSEEFSNPGAVYYFDENYSGEVNNEINKNEIYSDEIYYVSGGNIQTIDNPNIFNFPGGARVNLVKVEGSPPFKTGDMVEVTVPAGEGYDEYVYRAPIIDATVESDAYLWLPEGEYEFRAAGYVPAKDAARPANDSVVKLYASDENALFRDVRETDWFYEAAVYAVNSGLVLKTGGEFKPDSETTRGVLAALIGRLHGADLSGYDYSSFDDVSKEKAYSPYVEWVKDAGVMPGTEGNRFEADRAITREELAAILLRYYKYAAGKDLEIIRKYEPFSDFESISEYARPAAEALQNLDIIAGKPGNIFDPGATVTRAETAQALYLLGKIIFGEG
jgi:hypothetical protein